ncbi:MAG: glycoside hydrolase family 2 TIM barrel-domain containing protein [Planctomycetota bacterium]
MSNPAPSPRTSNFNHGWRFNLGDVEAASQPAFDDADWRGLSLPHDWSVEHPFDEKLEGCTGYLPGGIGWYRKRFVTPESVPGGRTLVVFDGIYNRSEIWINGKSLGFRPYGYVPIVLDLTDHLVEAGGENILAVRVDHSHYGDSRWYTGSGIYRDVELIQVGPTHIPVWGKFVTTSKVTDSEAQVQIETQINHTGSESVELALNTCILDADGNEVAKASSPIDMASGAQQSFTQQLLVAQPKRWGIDTPNMYRAVTTLEKGGEVLDRYETPFGIRTIRFDKHKGFFLNEEHTLIKGVCLHHDGGLVGAAVPLGVWRRRLETLREGGCNAIRTAHNPPSAEFLDLCDEMGFLVQDEFYDEWDNPKDKRQNCNEKERDEIVAGHDEFFQEWAERDLKDTMLRDRNHPCVFQWSIGNEIEWTYPNYSKATGFFDMDWTGNYFWSQPPIGPEEIKKRILETETGENGEYVCATTAQKLAAWTRELDSTRPITANCILPSASHASGYADALDVVGYSYRRVMYDYGQEISDKCIMGTENVPHWHEWKAVVEREFVSGLFLWTGIDYMGESNKKWTSKSTRSGLLDTTGFGKPSYHLYKTLWSDEPHAQLFTIPLEDSVYEVGDGGELVEKEPGSWERRLWFWHPLNPHWEYEPGQKVVVEAMTNMPNAELLLNGEKLGARKLEDQDDRICRWLVEYQPGELSIHATDGQATAKHTLAAPSAAAGIHLTVDQTQLAADGRDVAHVVAQLVDAEGRPVRSENREIVFELGEGLRLLGVDNGAHDNTQPYASDRLVTHHGRALLIVQATAEAPEVSITATSGELAPASVSLELIGSPDTGVLLLS